jgi:heme exporter protein CcmD
MSFDMENAKAGYVIAAYLVAAVALLGLLVGTGCRARRRQAEWKALESRRRQNS